MADYSRSKSYAYGNGGGSSSAYNDMQLQPYSASGQQQPPQVHPRYGDLSLRCYSATYAQAQMDMWGSGGGYGSHNLGELPNDFKVKKGTGSNSSWAVSDPEFQRKKRVAGYKMYAVQGKMKGSFRKSFRWLKDRYSQVVHGWW